MTDYTARVLLRRIEALELETASLRCALQQLTSEVRASRQGERAPCYNEQRPPKRRAKPSLR